MKVINLTEDEWLEKYKPIKNHFPTRNGAWDDCEFETYGKELDYVYVYARYHPNHVWTHVVEEGVGCIVSGMYLANRFGYFITKTPFGDDETIEILLDGVEEEEEE